jgi:hypothetical protein
MKKDAYYFPHDSNAKDDPKCMMLIEQLGLEGYGIFWVLVETLRDQQNYKYPIALLPAIARRYNTTFEKVKTVVYNYSLFMIENDEFFFSNSLNSRMKAANFNRISGIKGALKKHGYLTGEQLNNMSEVEILDYHELVKNKQVSPLPSPLDTPPLALESKGKETKVNKSKVELSIDFYQNQIELNANSENIKYYKSFFAILIENNPDNDKLEGVLSMPKQVSYKSFCNLLEKSKTKNRKFSDMLPTMDNDPKYYKKKSLSKTLHTWLNRD